LVELLAGQIGAAVERSSIAGTEYRLTFQETVGRASQPVH
jgi:two-component sensor histidine kinase